MSEVDARRVARILAVQYLFSKYNNQDTIAFEASSLLSILEVNDYDKKLYEALINGVENNLEEVDNLIKENAPSRPIDDIYPINRVILRLAIWEGYIGKITPPKVAINEAIEIAKALGSEEDGSFINGVLGNLFEKKLNIKNTKE